MWYTSVSELNTSLLMPPEFVTCSQIQLSDSSALLDNVSSHVGGVSLVTKNALSL